MIRNSDRKLWSWACYDFANTIFSATILTVYFPLYLTELMGKNWSLGAATTASMILAGFAVPFLGALSDQTGKTKAYLIRTTLATLFFLCLLSTTKIPSLLILTFLAACFFYHASLVFYNSLLPVVVPPERQGFASGLGTGLGYLGVVASLPVMHLVDGTWGRPAVFIATAGAFLIFSLPLFFFVPERETGTSIPFQWNLWKKEWLKIFETLKNLRTRPKTLLFFGGNFFVVDALNSAIFWLTVYLRDVFHLEQAALVTFVITLNASAFAAGILMGLLTDCIGAMRTLLLSSGALTLTLAVLAWTSNYAIAFLICVVGGAAAISGIWTAGRKALLELSPAEKTGEFFGLYGLTTKISVLGSFAFSIVADISGMRIALWLLVCPAVLGTLLLAWSARTKRT